MATPTARSGSHGDVSKAGIQITTIGQSFSTMLGEINNTNKSWVMGDNSGWAYDGPGFMVPEYWYFTQ